MEKSCKCWNIGCVLFLFGFYIFIIFLNEELFLFLNYNLVWIEVVWNIFKKKWLIGFLMVKMIVIRKLLKYVGYIL